MIRATQVAQLLPAGKGPPSEQLSLPGRGGPAAGPLGSRADAYEIWDCSRYEQPIVLY